MRFKKFVSKDESGWNILAQRMTKDDTNNGKENKEKERFALISDTW